MCNNANDVWLLAAPGLWCTHALGCDFSFCASWRGGDVAAHPPAWAAWKTCRKSQPVPTMGDIKGEEGEKAKTFPRHGPVGTSEGSRVPLACKVCQGGIPDLPASSQCLAWIFYVSGLYFPATNGQDRDDIQSGACLMVESLRKDVVELLAESD